MKIKLSSILIISLATFVVILGCSTTPTSTPTPTTTPTPQNQQPIVIISVLGPLQPINPGGPNVEITLKNISPEPIVTLIVTLELNRPFNFAFDISLPVPLLPDNTISAKQTLIGGGFSDNLSYPLTISGTLRNGVAFGYTKQVKIAAP